MHSIQFGSTSKKIKIENGFLQPYILDGHNRVITKKSIQRIFGHTGKSDWLSDFTQAFTRYGIVSPVLLEKISNPLIFKVSKSDDFPTVEEGYDITTLKQICEFIIFAKTEGYLSVIELKMATIAQQILDADNKTPFDWKIDEITGFNFQKGKTKKYLIDYMTKHQPDAYLNWIASFEDAFLEALFNYYGMTWETVKSNPKQVAKFIEEMIFQRIDADLLQKLENSKPKREYTRRKGPQNNQHPDLKQHLDLLQSMMLIAGNNHAILEQLIEKAKPNLSGKPTIIYEDIDNTPESLNYFDKQLKKALLRTKEV